MSYGDKLYFSLWNHCCSSGIDVDFVGHPYSRIYVSSNVYFLIKISKQRYYHSEHSSSKQGWCHVLEIDTVVLERKIFKLSYVLSLFCYCLPFEKGRPRRLCSWLGRKRKIGSSNPSPYKP